MPLSGVFQLVVQRICMCRVFNSTKSVHSLSSLFWTTNWKIPVVATAQACHLAQSPQSLRMQLACHYLSHHRACAVGMPLSSVTTCTVATTAQSPQSMQLACKGKHAGLCHLGLARAHSYIGFSRIVLV